MKDVSQVINLPVQYCTQVCLYLQEPIIIPPKNIFTAHFVVDTEKNEYYMVLYLTCQLAYVAMVDEVMDGRESKETRMNEQYNFDWH